MSFIPVDQLLGSLKVSDIPSRGGGGGDPPGYQLGGAIITVDIE